MPSARPNNPLHDCVRPLRTTPWAVCVVALLLATAWPPPQAFAQAGTSNLRRCTGVGGVTVYTDRACADVGAVERLPGDRSHAAASGSAWRMQQRGCARTVQDLVYEITFAIDSQDVNRLAGVYHWVGMSGAGGYATMGRLEAIAKRPLVDIVPVYPRPRGVTDADGNVIDENLDGFYPQTTRPRPPTGLRVEQTLGKTSTPSRTVFGLHRHMDCWWLTL